MSGFICWPRVAVGRMRLESRVLNAVRWCECDIPVLTGFVRRGSNRTTLQGAQP